MFTEKSISSDERRAQVDVCCLGVPESGNGDRYQKRHTPSHQSTFVSVLTSRPTCAAEDRMRLIVGIAVWNSSIECTTDDADYSRNRTVTATVVTNTYTLVMRFQHTITHYTVPSVPSNIGWATRNKKSSSAFRKKRSKARVPTKTGVTWFGWYVSLSRSRLITCLYQLTDVMTRLSMLCHVCGHGVTIKAWWFSCVLTAR